jgi:hypothetical protein
MFAVNCVSGYIWKTYNSLYNELSSFKYMYIHDFVKDIFCDIFRRACVSMKKEAHMNLLTDPHPQKGRLMYRNTHVWNLNYLSFPTCGFENMRFYYKTSKPQSASNKVAKHEKTCFDNQHAFISFVFDIFGSLTPDVVIFPKEFKVSYITILCRLILQI